MVKTLVLKWLFTQALKVISKGIVKGKKGLEKDYIYFRLFRNNNLENKLVDTPLSIYLETIFLYEKERGEEKAKLFYLNDAFKAFNEYYNQGVEWALKTKIDDTLHTSNKLLALKKEVIDQQGEIDFFIKTFKSIEKKAANQSNAVLLASTEDIKEGISDIKSLLQSESAENQNISYVFNTKLEKIENQIPRKIISLEDYNNKKTPFIEIKKTDLKSVCEKQPRVVLLANGGMGKSMELKNLVYCVGNDLVPIYKTFKSYTNQEIEKHLPSDWKFVPEKKLLLVLDGLDEVRNEDFTTAIKNLNAFIEKHPEVSIVVSCRTNHLDSSLNQLGGAFEPYYLEPVNIHSKEVQEYIKSQFNIDYEKFVNIAFEFGYLDLTDNPFYLNKMLEIFAREGSLQKDRAQLFEHFVDANLEFDKEKYNLTLDDIKYKQIQLLKKLEYIALAMETYGKNEVNVHELADFIDLEKDIELIKYTKSFKKIEDEGTEKWQFDHRLIQEFLAARALSKLSFGQIIEFISFTIDKKIIPSWANTITFLFSLIDGKKKLNDLTDWIIENDRDSLIKVEREKISEEIRANLFKEIFCYYKTHDVRINSNKYTDKDLARFGQSESSIQFLINELNNTDNTKIIRLNAINLLGYFEFTNNGYKDEVEKLLLKHIERHEDDPSYIHSTIYALKRAGFTNRKTIEHIIQKVGGRKNQYIRAAVYAILLKSDVLEEYTEYLIKGYEITNEIVEGERDEVSLMDEGWNLKECITNIKSPKAINKLIEYISESTKFEFAYDTDDVLKAIIDNAIIAYHKDASVYVNILNWYLKIIRRFGMEKMDLVITFFDETSTREKAFHEIWETNEDRERNKSLAIAKLTTPNLIRFIVNQYIEKNITPLELESVLYDMKWVSNIETGTFENMLIEKTDFEIKKPIQIDYEGIRKSKLKVNFSLLFDQSSFKKEVLRVFDEQEKEELSFDELYELRKDNNSFSEMEDHYSDVALGLLRNFVNSGQVISKKQVINWFEGKGGEERYRVKLIYNYLSNHKEIEVSKEQELWIVNWCKANVSEINFKEALKVSNDGRITFNNLAMYVWYFSKRWNINHKNEILLDMLSFDCPVGNEWPSIDYIIGKLGHEEICERMLNNLENGLIDSSVLKNHISYLVENKVTKSYSYILDEIININWHDYQRKEYLDIYFKQTEDTEGLKALINSADFTIKWYIIDKLKANGEESFIEEYLLQLIKKNIEPEDKGKATGMLVSLQNIDGLKSYIEWIKENLENDIDTSKMTCLNSLKTKETIPYLIELLELSYSREAKVDRFDRFNSLVLGAIYNVALVSGENFKQVKVSLENFMNEKVSVYNNAKYLLHTIERLEEQFYINHIKSFTIKEVKEKLKILE